MRRLLLLVVLIVAASTQADICSIDSKPGATLLFNYANLCAQGLWELDWDAFVGMPSRRSAEVEARGDRSTALRSALSEGWLEGYSGIRITASGRRFKIFDGLIWNLLDGDGVRRGQAATFSRWEFV